MKLRFPLAAFRWGFAGVWAALAAVHVGDGAYVSAGVALFTGAALYVLGQITEKFSKLTTMVLRDATLFHTQLRQLSKMAADWHTDGTCASCGKPVTPWDIGVDCIHHHRCHVECLAFEDEGGRVRPRCPLCLASRRDHAPDQCEEGA